MICYHLITFLIGFLITKSFLKETVNIFLIFSFSVAFGIATEAFLMFILMLFNMNNNIIFAITEITLLLTAITVSKIKKAEYSSQSKDENNYNNKYLIGIFIVAVLTGLIHVFYTVKMHPYGTWDAHYIWNLRPRFFIALQEAGESWKTFFYQIPAWTHPDYPLLIPVYNYKNHILNNSYNPALNTWTSILILSAIVSGVYGLVNEISSRQNALLATIILLTTECFMFLSMSQCADVPISLFILTATASISLFVKYKNQAYILFAYYFAASAAFCKNEGIMFLLIFTIVSLILIKNQNKKMIIYGAILPLMCLFLDKILLNLNCDLFENQTFDMILNRLFSIERYKTILSIVTQHFLENFSTYIIFFIVVYFSGFTENDRVKTLSKMFISIVILAMLGYFTIYLITPRELVWHINTTDVRLITQYIPLFIAYCFTAFNCANDKALLPNIEHNKSE